MTDGPDNQIVTCYTIPGLGGTPEIFDKLEFPPRIKKQPLYWIAHRHKESLKDYAERLLPQIDGSRPFILVGYSFGAAIAVELAKQASPLLTVVISGVKSEREMPFYLGRAELFGAYTKSVFVHSLWAPLLRLGARISFGTNDPTALDMLVRLIQTADPKLYQWGLKALMDWENGHVPGNILHIHGSKDRVLPLRYVTADKVIEGGGHLIVYTHGKEIGDLIASRLRLPSI